MKVKNIRQWFYPAKPSEYNSFKEFWPHYLELHKNEKVLDRHVKGTVAGVTGGTTATVTTLFTDYWYLSPLLFPVVLAAVTYSIVIPSHKKYGGNKAATLESLKHAAYSILGDFKMCYMKLRGNLDSEFERLGIKKENASN